MTKALYYEMCEVTQSEPEQDKIPIEFHELTLSTRAAMQIVELLPDKFVEGVYIGKDTTTLEYFISIYAPHINKKLIILLVSRIISKTVSIMLKKGKNNGKEQKL